MKLNRSQGEIYIARAEPIGLGAAHQFDRVHLQHGPAAALDCLPPAGQAGEKVSHLFPHCSTDPQAQVGDPLLAHPAPHGLVSVAI